MRNDSRRAGVAAAVLAVGAAAALPARADKAGMDALRKMLGTYRNLKSYQDSWTRAVESGNRREAASGSLRVAMPNKFLLTIDHNGKPAVVLAGDGKRTISYVDHRKQYAQEPGQKRLPAQFLTSDHPALRMMAGGILTSDVEDARIVEKTTVNGAPVQVVKLAFRVPPRPKDKKKTSAEQAKAEKEFADAIRKNQPDVRYYIGVSDGLMYRNEMNANGQTRDGKAVKVTVRQDFRNIRVNQALAASVFSFRPPSGAKRVTVKAKG